MSAPVGMYDCAQTAVITSYSHMTYCISPFFWG